jgi:replicative DNA helicase
VLFAVDMRNQAANDDPDEVIGVAMQALYDMGRASRGRSLVTAADAARDAMRHIEKLAESKGEITGISTGFADLDNMLLGFHEEELIILAARPSMGKTALALDLAANMAERQKAGLFVQLEMGSRALAMRMLASRGRVDAQRVRKGMFEPSDWARLARATMEIAAAPIVFDESAVTSLADVRLTARRLRQQGKLDWVIIDYLQLMSASKERDSREREVSELSRGLKQLAKELRVPILALSQLNRGVEARQNKRPIMSDLRESGAIEQDADVIMFLYRDEVYDEDSEDKGIAEVGVAKQRNGPTGIVRMRFNKQTQRFDSLAGGQR